MTAEAEAEAKGDRRAVVAPPGRMRRLIAVVAVGSFATGLGWPISVGELSFNGLLKDQLKLSPHEVTAFWAVAGLSWYLKPLAGLITDAYPLFGTRRRGYMLWGTIVACLAWLGFVAIPPALAPLLVLTTGLNVAIVFVSVAVSGLLVQTGQDYRATGLVSALFTGIDAAVPLVTGYLAGWLASRAFGWTAVAGAVILGSFIPVVAFGYREPAGARPDRRVWAAAKQNLRAIVGSRATWAAGILLFLIFFTPSFATPLYFYQRDVLRFSPQLIGTLRTLGGAGGLIGAGLYSVVCRRLSLRTSLIAGVLIVVASNLLYLRYDSALAAVLIDTTATFLGSLGVVPIYDLATRAIPKGSENFGFGLVIGIRNVAYFGVANNLGALLYERHGFKPLVWISALTTLLVLPFIGLIPRPLLAAREGERRRADAGRR